MIFQFHVNTVGYAEVLVLAGVLYAVHQIARQPLCHELIVEGDIQCHRYRSVGSCFPARQIFCFEHHIFGRDGIGIFTGRNIELALFFEATDICICPALYDSGNGFHVLAALGAEGFEIGLSRFFQQTR